jgi:ParB family chromosome partitioning protein
MNNRLGKGIEALIRSRDLNKDEYLDGFVDIKKIQTNINQPRKHFDDKSLNELVESIREKGILQPITIKEMDNGLFELIAGERRFRAAKILNLKTVPAYIIKVDSDAEKLELALVENIQRSDLNAIEEAEAYCVLKNKYGLTHDQIAQKVGKSRVEVTRTMDLVNLPENIKKVLTENCNNSKFPFSRGHARTILGLKDSIKIQTLFNRILKENLSVRKTEQLVKKINGGSQSSANTKTKNSTIVEDEKILSNFLSAKTEVSNKKNNSGHIKILFKSAQDRERIIDLIKSIKKIK